MVDGHPARLPGAAPRNRAQLSALESGYILLFRRAIDVADPTVLVRAPATGRRCDRFGWIDRIGPCAKTSTLDCLPLDAIGFADIPQKRSGPVALRVAEELFCGPLLIDRTAVQEADFGRYLACKAHLMRREQHGHTFNRKLPYDVQYLGYQFSVERRSDLIQKQDHWVHR